jgi:hypothetical protein
MIRLHGLPPHGGQRPADTPHSPTEAVALCRNRDSSRSPFTVAVLLVTLIDRLFSHLREA